MKIKKVIFSIILIALILPGLQVYFSLFKIPPLNGVFIEPKEPYLKSDVWLSGDFQKNYDKYLEHHIGFRNFFIRLNNQLQFWLYKQTATSNVIIGKDNVLYQDFYVDAYLGKDFIGEAELSEKIRKLKFIQDTLARKNIDLVFIIAPGKASIMSESIPSNYDLTTRTISNYDMTIEKIKDSGVNYIDFKNYFLQIKDSCSHPLFPKCGTHWSGYGLTLVADSTFRYIEKLTGNDLPDFIIKPGYETDSELRYTDSDIGDAMNLLFDIQSDKLYYPEVVFEENTSKRKLNTLSIGDSYNQSFWGFYPFYDSLFSHDSRYWSSYRDVAWPWDVPDLYQYVNQLDLQKQIESRDLIIIVLTECNLKSFGFGFIEDTYEIYNNNTVPPKDIEPNSFEDYLWRLRNSNKWMASVLEQANTNGIEPEDNILLNAAYMVMENNKEAAQEIRKIEERLFGMTEIMTMIEKVAKHKNISQEGFLNLKAMKLYYKFRKQKTNN